MIKAATQTLAAIDAAIVAKQEFPFRKHLGASLIGDECARRLWYVFRWAKAENFEPRMLRLFNRGHLEEKRIVQWLRNAGIEVWEAGEAGDLKARMRVSAHFGHFGGTPDAVGRGFPELPSGEPALLEFKTHGDKSFTKLKAEGLMMSKWKHFVQMQVYMHEHKLRFGVYIAINKNTDELFIEAIEYDGIEGARAIERAGRIIFAKEPPLRVAKLPTSPVCKFCHLARLCWFGDVKPERNCRTCKHSLPLTDGSGNWGCLALHNLAPEHGIYHKELDEAAQRAACPHYETKAELVGKQP